MTTNEAGKESLNQKFARKNAWLTKAAFIAMGLALAATLFKMHH